MCNQLDVIYWLLENATLNASDIWSLKSINKYIAKKVVQISVSTGKKILNSIYLSRNANQIKNSTWFCGWDMFVNPRQPIVLIRFLSTWCKLEYSRRGTSIKIMPSIGCLWQLHSEFLWLMFNTEGQRPQGKTYHPWAGRRELLREQDELQMSKSVCCITHGY